MILGIFWGMWHLPWCFYPGQWQYGAVHISLWWFPVFVISTVTGSLIISTGYILSDRRTIRGATLHAAQNVTIGLFYTVLSIPEQNQLALINIAVDIVILCVIALAFKNKFKQKFEQQTLRYRTEWNR